MSGALTTLPETLLLVGAPGEILAGNPLLRTWALGDAAFVELLAALRGGDSEALRERFAGATFVVRDASAPPFADGLLGDPTGLDRAATLEGVEPIDLEAALALARRLVLAVEDEEAYAASLGTREHALDRTHHGNVHQRVGEYVARTLRRRDLDGWWADQKFTPDHRAPREGPYRWVQWEFMAERFPAGSLAGRHVLDFGCGPGLFARLFARAGALVTATDTNTQHLETLQRLAVDDAIAEQIDTLALTLPVEDGLASLTGAQFDYIFLSDVLMFYFHSYDPSVELDPAALLTTLGGLLAPGGRIAILEPNGAFWQQPWLGSPQRPLTVLSEYRHRWHGVTPTLEELSRAAEAAGLAIATVRELVPGDDAPQDRAAGFAAEFPLWWYFELRA
ncbi:MAG: class I SAM-dependent methyltransferase [Baekduia sp.]